MALSPTSSVPGGTSFARRSVTARSVSKVRRSRLLTPIRRDSSCESARSSSASSCTSTRRSEEHTSELQSLMRISYAVFCLKKKNNYTQDTNHDSTGNHDAQYRTTTEAQNG